MDDWSRSYALMHAHGARQGERAAGAAFPQGLLQLLAGVMAGAKSGPAAAAAPSPPALRQQAHLLGVTALRLVEGHLSDSAQLLLASAAWHEARAPHPGCCTTYPS